MKTFERHRRSWKLSNLNPFRFHGFPVMPTSYIENDFCFFILFAQELAQPWDAKPAKAAEKISEVSVIDSTQISPSTSQWCFHLCFCCLPIHRLPNLRRQGDEWTCCCAEQSKWSVTSHSPCGMVPFEDSQPWLITFGVSRSSPLTFSGSIKIRFLLSAYKAVSEMAKRDCFWICSRLDQRWSEMKQICFHSKYVWIWKCRKLFMLELCISHNLNYFLFWIQIWRTQCISWNKLFGISVASSWILLVVTSTRLKTYQRLENYLNGIEFASDGKFRELLLYSFKQKLVRFLFLQFQTKPVFQYKEFQRPETSFRMK